MWERFTDAARRVVMHAEDSARNYGIGTVITDLILLGIIKESECIACKIMQKFGADLDEIKKEIEDDLAVIAHNSFEGDVRLSYSAKKILEMSAEEAKSLLGSYVGTEHILLALLRLSSEKSYEILDRKGLKYEDVKNDLINYVTLNSTEPKINLHSNRRKHSILDIYSKDLTQLALNGELDPCIGRDNIISRVIQILSRRTKNNPCLLGEAGVGKTAIVDGLAIKIASGDVPYSLRGKRLISLNIGQVLAGAKYRGEFEDRIQKIIEEIKASHGNIIVFIDEVHTLVGAGASEGSLDAANMLKPALARNEFQCICATTNNDFKKYIETDSALERRLQIIKVPEPDVKETIAILYGLKHRYEDFHNVIISDEAISSAVNLSDRYISERALPDKAIDVLDEACSKVKLRDYFQNISDLDNDSVFDIGDAVVAEEDVTAVIQDWTSIPIIKLKESDNQRLLGLEAELHKRIIGQHKAISVVSKAIRRSKSGIQSPKRPIGSFIFLGPTGVGKTELARVLSEYLLGSEKNLLRFDMSEYMEKHSVSRLIGSPPGYVGYEEGGRLTEAVKRNPYSVILFDEIEKAHYDVFNILLQILDDGRLTDSKGRTVDFKNTIVIMTGNIGASEFTNSEKLGFSKNSYSEDLMKTSINNELKKTFRPEFLNRVDDVIIFDRLNKSEVKEIAKILINDLAKLLKTNGYTLLVSDRALDFIAAKGYDSQNGARPLKRAIQNYIENPISEGLLASDFIQTGAIFVDCENEQELTFTAKESTVFEQELVLHV